MGEWNRRNQALDGIRKSLKESPANLELASRYWIALAGDRAKGEADYRSGLHVIEAYREAALSSTEGAASFARSYRELCQISGEDPRLASFDERLIQALTASISGLSGIDRSNVQWVLRSIGMTQPSAECAEPGQ